MLPLFGLLLNHTVLAAPDDATSRAAALFEQGVRQFSRAEYASAAEAFLAADELAPNTQAIVNGITAARRAGLHLLVARAAERALARPDVDVEGTNLAREALADAARNLTRVEVTCSVSPCTLTLDGVAIAPGASYVLPGTHDFVGTAPGTATATEHMNMVAGASYRVVLSPRALEPSPSERDAPAGLAPRADERKPLAPAFFYVGAAATAVMAGLTIWSGLDTLSVRSDATEANWDHVERLARRTDILLAGSIILGGATAVAGLTLVDWGPASYAGPALVPGGAALVARGRF